MNLPARHENERKASIAKNKEQQQQSRKRKKEREIDAGIRDKITGKKLKTTESPIDILTSTTLAYQPQISILVASNPQLSARKRVTISTPRDCNGQVILPKARTHTNWLDPLLWPAIHTAAFSRIHR